MLTVFATFALPALLASLTTALFILGTKRLHGQFTFDSNRGVQKIHTSPTPRVGGLAVVIGLIVGLTLAPDVAGMRSLGFFLIFAALPALIVGLWEDIAKSVAPRTRLSSHVASALILVLGGGYVLRHTGFELTDPIMSITPFAVLLSVFAVAGMTNAVNIIDGFNGLASGTVMIMTVGLGLLAVRLGDVGVFLFCMILFFSILGFFVVNFPFGKVFLGDAGAYFCGFLTCGLVLVLSARHPGLSPWVPLLVIIYPAWEVMVSILRRMRRKGHKPSQADRVHLHHLISRSFARPLAKQLGWAGGRNPMTGMMLWPLALLPVLIAANVEMSSVNALLGIFVFQAFYDRINRKLRYFRPVKKNTD